MLRWIGSLIGLALLLFLGVFVVRYFFGNTGGTPTAKVRIGDNEYAVEVARTQFEQMRGLAYRDSLSDGRGMLFIFSKPKPLSFVMQGMRFPLDMIWIRDGKIVDISENLPPDKGVIPKVYRPNTLADWVLEVNAGTVERDGIKMGDTVEYIQ